MALAFGNPRLFASEASALPHTVYDNGVRKITFRDPDGNQIGFGGAPLEASLVELAHVATHRRMGGANVKESGKFAAGRLPRVDPDEPKGAIRS
jgi:hypothetical protein